MKEKIIMSENYSPNNHNIFKSPSIQLTSAILSELPDSTFLGFEDDLIDTARKVILISYPKSQESELNKIVQEFGSKVLIVNLFFYNRNLNYLRDRLFKKRT